MSNGQTISEKEKAARIQEIKEKNGEKKQVVELMESKFKSSGEQFRQFSSGNRQHSYRYNSGYNYGC